MFKSEADADRFLIACECFAASFARYVDHRIAETSRESREDRLRDTLRKIGDLLILQKDGKPIPAEEVASQLQAARDLCVDF